MTTPATAASLRFGRFELQVHERRLLIDGAAAPLGGRAFDLLLALAERPGRLVDKRTLMDLVWPGRVVQENNLAAQASALRKVLGDEIIASVPGRGYRFVARIDAGEVTRLPAATGERVGKGVGEGVAPAATAPRTNLPAALPALLGRTEDLAALGAQIDRHRLVTVVGAGGIGKSLLAQHLLGMRRGAYGHGVCWVELSPVTDAALLPGAVAAALGVHVSHGEPLAALVSAVAPLELLLALDNAEHHLADVAALCQALHDAAPGLRLLVTSQAALRVAAERVFRIGPLAVPMEAMPAAQAQQFGAVALFAERAHAADGRFALTDTNTSTVIEICRALDGLPLAIELAAARAPALGVQALASGLRDRLKLLTSSRNRAAPPRQQTLRAALAWSHDLLSPREQRVYRRLGVMAGSASLEFIQQVLSDEPERSPPDDGQLDTWAVLDALDVLVDRSLVAVLPVQDEGAPRYRLLESPRAHALERLDEAGERAALQGRHARALAARFDVAYDDYFSGRTGADDWQRRLDPDLDNARDAIAWARAESDLNVELTLGATLLRALPPSLHSERMALADACAARLAAPGRPEEATQPAEAGPSPEPTVAALPTRLQQRAWVELGCAWADTQKPRGRDAADQALRLARRIDPGAADRFMHYHALCRVASAAAQAGDLAAALGPLDALQALEDPTWPAQRLLWGTEVRQVVARLRGDTAEALRLSRRLLALDRERGGGGSIALGNLIDAELAAGDVPGAVRSGTEFVAALQGTRDEYTLAYARINLCAACLALGDTAQARSIMRTTWPQVIAFEMQHYAAAYLALLAALEARPRSAARLLAGAQALYAARNEACETNEAAAMARARALARSALGDTGFDRALAEGAALRDSDIATLAFGTTDD